MFSTKLPFVPRQDKCIRVLACSFLAWYLPFVCHCIISSGSIVSNKASSPLTAQSQNNIIIRQYAGGGGY